MATIRRKKPESFAILSSPGPWPQVLINWLATLAVIIVFGLIMLFSASYTTGYLRMSTVRRMARICFSPAES